TRSSRVAGSTYLGNIYLRHEPVVFRGVCGGREGRTGDSHVVGLLRFSHNDPEIADVGVLHGHLDRPRLPCRFRLTRIGSRRAVAVNPERVGEAEGADAAGAGIGPHRVRTGWDVAKGESSTGVGLAHERWANHQREEDIRSA